MAADIHQRSAIVSCDADSEFLVLEELRRCGGAVLPGQWIDSGDAVQGSMLLVEIDEPFEEFSTRLDEFGSVFTRHLAPVDDVVQLRAEESDLDLIVDLAPRLAARMDSRSTFSVQSRITGLGKLPYRKVVLNERLSQALEQETGAALDCRRPEQVVSVVCTPDRALVGLSKTRFNRSEWPGGRHRFKREDDQVSRAEFKLLEAFSVFAVELPTQGRALDIGASPGGWSRVLAAHGLHVDAVDPASLDPRLRRYRGITHHRRRIQEYSPGSKEFAVIVNDMKMDARDSIAIMLDYAGRLSSDGLAIMTLKLPKPSRNPNAARIELDRVLSDLKLLATRYRLIGARQLYHNRSEVTVVMSRSR